MFTNDIIISMITNSADCFGVASASSLRRWIWSLTSLPPLPATRWITNIRASQSLRRCMGRSIPRPPSARNILVLAKSHTIHIRPKSGRNWLRSIATWQHWRKMSSSWGVWLSTGTMTWTMSSEGLWISSWINFIKHHYDSLQSRHRTH